MEKIILTVLLLFFYSFTNAQITKGNWMVGGSGSFNNYKSTYEYEGVEYSSELNYATVNSDIGYFFHDNIVAGAALNYYGNYPKGDFKASHNYGAGPFVRYYILKPEKVINVFTQAGVIIRGAKNSSGTFGPSYSYPFKAGTAIFFNSSVALELSLNYNIDKLDGAGGNQKTTNNTFTIGIGFQIHLEKK
ncbi:hypothetical protein SLW70_02095 [Flavobacterium sp. NG2]|uniref:hypothetical protein n=1 Tax=Flavobacterium sp. NG2 TaxID=3097547 RepID=UPI002A83656F|nr:hypothetical protein [Flavobacterium sp. NG2]WPR71944.1 hypothetical protein SLW70_02095 [Flavobacterium sp. NG2]